MTNDVKQTAIGAARGKPFKGQLQIGQSIAGKGVFIGTKEFRDKNSCSLGMFNLFAAPYDLGLDETGRGQKILGAFNDAVAHVAGIRNLMGHDGGHFNSAASFENALREKRYGGEWFIPQRDILERNMYENRSKGALSGTFVDVIGAGCARWYWSSSERPRFFNGPLPIAAISFTDGSAREAYRETELELSTRPIRAEQTVPTIKTVSP